MNPLNLAFSATAPALPYYLHPCRHPFGEGNNENLLGLVLGIQGDKFCQVMTKYFFTSVKPWLTQFLGMDIFLMSVTNLKQT